MGAPLTERQRQILDFIRAFQLRRGISPTHREICDEFGFASYGTAHKHLKLLERKGYLTRTRHQRRGVELVSTEGGPARKGRGAQLPLLGRIAAGQPLDVFPQEEVISIPDFLLGSRRRSHYVLEVSGTSMIDEGIHEGDFIVVSEREEARRGEMVVALVDGEATLKRFFPEGPKVRLQPANPQLRPLRVEASRVRVQGVVVGLLRRF